MEIKLFSHPPFIGSQSMPRFASFLKEGLTRRGHQVEIWAPEPRFQRLSSRPFIKKWLGYIDQFVIFPLQIKRKIMNCPKNTLFVFADQALGPWVPMVAKRPHTVHCHDFMAQRSAEGAISENPTSRTGKYYQSYIRKGYRQAKNFISVSEKTEKELLHFLSTPPEKNTVVYNGLNQDFSPKNIQASRKTLSELLQIDLSEGYVLHVGGNQWYKNRSGVLEIYQSWQQKYPSNLPLLMIGAPPDSKLTFQYNTSRLQDKIHFLSGIDDSTLRLAYAGCSVFVFPSIAEGFGWPIAEAMASGRPVITTNEAPMTEVGGKAAYYVPKRPFGEDTLHWADLVSETLNEVLNFPAQKQSEIIEASVLNAKRFDQQKALDKIEAFYFQVLQSKNLINEDTTYHS